MDERIELLSVSLLDSERKGITELKNLAQRLKLEFGWHYLLDISWILSNHFHLACVNANPVNIKHPGITLIHLDQHMFVIILQPIN